MSRDASVAGLARPLARLSDNPTHGGGHVQIARHRTTATKEPTRNRATPRSFFFIIIAAGVAILFYQA